VALPGHLFEQLEFANGWRNRYPDRLKDFAAGSPAFAACGKSFAVLFKDCHLHGMDDLAPFGREQEGPQQLSSAKWYFRKRPVEVEIAGF
jgi:hypothetical protein